MEAQRTDTRQRTGSSDGDAREGSCEGIGVWHQRRRARLAQVGGDGRVSAELLVRKNLVLDRLSARRHTIQVGRALLLLMGGGLSQLVLILGLVLLRLLLVVSLQVGVHVALPVALRTLELGGNLRAHPWAPSAQTP